MQCRPMPGMPAPVSSVVLGTMILDEADPAAAFALLDAAADNGITMVDTAHIYGGGMSERLIGRWFAQRGGAGDMQVLSKGCHHDDTGNRVTPAALEHDLSMSLQRLGIDSIDCYVLHRDDPTQPVDAIVGALCDALDAGRIRSYGFSNWTHQRIAEARSFARERGLPLAIASSPNCTLAEQVAAPWGAGMISIGGTAGSEARAWYRKHPDIHVFAWSSLARGFFSGRLHPDNVDTTLDDAARRAFDHPINWQRLQRVERVAAALDWSVPSVALAWVLSQDMPMHALVGAANPQEVAQIAASADRRLDDEVCTWLLAGGSEPELVR